MFKSVLKGLFSLVTIGSKQKRYSAKGHIPSEIKPKENVVGGPSPANSKDQVLQ